jgi:hypothetical protein
MALFFTNYDNSGANAIANSLANLGANLGNAFNKQQERQLLSDIGGMVQSGNLKGAAEAAFKAGDTGTGVNLLKLIDEQDKRAAQQNADSAVFSSLNGAPQGSANTPMDLAGAIRMQESGNNPNIGTSVDGAQGIGQILPATFNRFAKPGERIDNPNDNLNVSNRILGTYMDKYKDPARAAVAYFSGEGNVAPPGSATPWKRDTHDGNNKYVSSYVNDVLGRMNVGHPQRVQVADASSAMPQSANIDALMSRRNNIMRMMSSQGISDNARQQLNTMLQDTTFQIERADRQANQNKPDIRQFGDTLYNIAGGQISPMMKIPETEKPANQDQGAAQTFSTRMRDAESVINSVDQNKKPIWQDAIGEEGYKNRTLEKVPVVGRGMMSENYQRYNDAKERFITSILRDESGATIGTEEFVREERKYFPQPGDKPAAIRDKAIARQNAISTLARQGTPQFQREFFGEKQSQNNADKSVSGDVKSAKPIPSNVLDEARAAIPRKGREAVINLLRQQGFDTNGL